MFVRGRRKGVYDVSRDPTQAAPNGPSHQGTWLDRLEAEPNHKTLKDPKVLKPNKRPPPAVTSVISGSSTVTAPDQQVGYLSLPSPETPTKTV